MPVDKCSLMWILSYKLPLTIIKGQNVHSKLAKESGFEIYGCFWCQWEVTWHSTQQWQQLVDSQGSQTEMIVIHSKQLHMCVKQFSGEAPKSVTAELSYRAGLHSVQTCRLCPLSREPCATVEYTRWLFAHLSALLNSTASNKHNQHVSSSHHIQSLLIVRLRR